MAARKLIEAEAAISKMRLADDRVTFESGWCDFVDSLQEFWVRFLHEGEMVSSRFRPWVGRIERERKRDPLLNYLYQARHQSQHGMLPVDWGTSRLVFGRGFSGRLYGLRTFADGTYEAKAESLSHPEQPFPVEYDFGDPQLPTIENTRYVQRFPPPREHLGVPLPDASPVNAALVAFGYYRSVLASAQDRFGQPGGDRSGGVSTR